MHSQVRELERGAQVVIATPGRALDHIRRGTLKLDNLRVLVLDEADEMLDMGFAEDLDAILQATPGSQTALFRDNASAHPPIAEQHQHLRGLRLRARNALAMPCAADSLCGCRAETGHVE
jgi:ATP-dependent RNA helicase DeaD